MHEAYTTKYAQRGVIEKATGNAEMTIEEKDDPPQTKSF